MDISKIDDDVRDSLRKRGHRDEDIVAMTPEAAFSEYCNWRGLLDFGPVLVRVLDGLRSAAAPGEEEQVAGYIVRTPPPAPAQLFVAAVLDGDQSATAGFAGNVITVFAEALEETGLPVTRDQILSCIDTQGDSLMILACSGSVRERLEEIRSRPQEWYQKMMAEARARISRMDQSNLD